MGDNLRMRPEFRQKSVGQIAGLQAAEADSIETLYTGAKFSNQLNEWRRSRRSLATAKSGFLSIGTQKNAGQNDLPMPGCRHPTGLLDHIINRLAPQRRPKLRDDAVGAMGIAAVLNLQERALMMRIALVQQREGMGSHA